MVGEGNLFDPARPSLGSELEALRQHLEALGSGPDAWEGHSDRPAGVSPGGGGPWAGGQWLGHFLPGACLWALGGLRGWARLWGGSGHPPFSPIPLPLQRPPSL